VATVKYYDDHNIADRVTETGKTLSDQLNRLKDAHPHVGDVRQIGLFGAVELVKDRQTREALCPYGSDPEAWMGRILKALSKRGFMTYTHENIVLIAPPLIITSGQIEEELAKMDAALSELGL